MGSSKVNLNTFMVSMATDMATDMGMAMGMAMAMGMVITQKIIIINIFFINNYGELGYSYFIQKYFF